ncbi:intracellular endo-alpha-(1-_5)-L-arabinanase [Abditibacteriota bacterium]|nr:intracellular endo-alpha-(1->5)-L-arabinanase [Abditibacteriota bacterium]
MSPFAPGTTGPCDQTRVHDPVIVRENGVYYLFSTGRGIALHSSRDRKTWTRAQRVWEEVPSWTGELIPGSTDHLWAPEIAFWNVKWHLYYSVSTFGKNRSAIGLMTNLTLDESRADYKWHDEGVVVQSNFSDDFNAIDPALARDENGKLWLFFGSFWSGIKAVELDEENGKPIAPDAPPLAIARRSSEDHDAVEAPYVLRRGGWFWLFVSFDACCRGVDSTYNIRVGRASQITGPYFDREGRPMLEGGGTLLRAGTQRWRGTGHNSIFEDEAGRDFVVYHAYDALERGFSKLRIEPLAWDDEGWPNLPRVPADDEELTL